MRFPAGATISKKRAIPRLPRSYAYRNIHHKHVKNWSEYQPQLFVSPVGERSKHQIADILKVTKIIAPVVCFVGRKPYERVTHFVTKDDLKKIRRPNIAFFLFKQSELGGQLKLVDSYNVSSETRKNELARPNFF